MKHQINHFQHYFCQQYKLYLKILIILDLAFVKLLKAKLIKFVYLFPAMNELAEILTYKLKFVSNFPQPNLTDQQQIQILLKEKKKQSLERIYEERLIQNILIKRIDLPYRMQEFFEKSKQIMQLSDKTFQPTKQTGENYDNIVQMYVQFFKKQNSLLRSQEIMHIYRKKLCERNMLLPTLFNWLAEWTRKKFIGFIKYHLTNLSKSKQLQQRQSPAKRARQNAKIQNSLKHASLSAKMPQEHLQKQNNKKSTLLHPYHSIAISKKIHQMKSLKLIQNKSYEEPLQIRPRQKKQKLIKEEQPQKIQMLFNKQLFFGAFSDEMQKYYKLMNGVISQLDMYYLKGIKRNDKKQQYKKSIPYLSTVLYKYQNNDIRNSIEQYYQNYSQKFPLQKPIKLFKKKSETKFMEPRIKSIVQRLHGTLQVKKHSINDSQLQNEIQNNSQQIFLKRQKQSKIKKQLRKSIQRLGTEAHYSFNIATIEYQHKKLQLKLPDISKNQSIKKILLGNHGRYSKIQKNFKHPISIRRSYDSSQQDISQQIQKEVRNMNQLFKQSRKLKKSRHQLHRSQLQKSSMIINNEETIFSSQANLQNQISQGKHLRQELSINRMHSIKYFRQNFSKHSKRNQSYEHYKLDDESPRIFFLPKIKQ